MEDLLFIIIYLLFDVIVMLGFYKTGSFLIVVLSFGVFRPEPFIKGESSKGNFYKESGQKIIGKNIIYVVGALFWVSVITGLVIWL